MVAAGAILGKASGWMPFSKDEEGLVCGREGKVLQEEEQPGPRQGVMGRNSFGQDGADLLQ